MKKQSMALFFTLLVGISAEASESLFYWDNNSGLKKADHCQLTTTKKSRFRFATKGAALKNSEGKSVMDIIPGTLIKKTDKESKIGSEVFEVVSANLNTSLDISQYAERNESGLFDRKNSENIEERIIEITENRYNLKAGTLLKVHGEGEYLKLACPEFAPERDYLVFHAYNRTSDKTIGLIGVYWDETNLFKSRVKTFTKEELGSSVNVILDEENIVLDQIRSVSGTPLEPMALKEGIVNEEVNDEAIAEGNNESVSVQKGLDTVICSSSPTVNVRNSDLEKVVFTAKNGEKIKVFQGFGGGDEAVKTKIVDGKVHAFVKVNFVDREADDQQIGYVVDSFIKPRSECGNLTISEVDYKILDTQIKGIDDPACCLFPTVRKVNQPFTEGMRSFLWARNRDPKTGIPGRFHAANDLYRFKDEAVVAVAPGVILRATYAFYEGTYTTEVIHSGGFVARYGEVTAAGAKLPGIRDGKTVKMGQKLGFIGKIAGVEPMLHFELYSGKVKGEPLSQLGNKSYPGQSFNGKNLGRRRDLLRPTEYLLKWENAKFKK